MSASMHWKHAPKEPVEEDSYIDHDTMYRLRKRYYDNGLPLHTEVLLTLQHDGQYLYGLADAGDEDAPRLLQLLKDNPDGILIYHRF